VLFDKAALTWLDLRATGIDDIGFLAGYTELTVLVPSDNPISNIAALEHLTLLDHLDLGDGRADDAAVGGRRRPTHWGPAEHRSWPGIDVSDSEMKRMELRSHALHGAG